MTTTAARNLTPGTTIIMSTGNRRVVAAVSAPYSSRTGERVEIACTKGAALKVPVNKQYEVEADDDACAFVPNDRTGFRWSHCETCGQPEDQHGA